MRNALKLFVAGSLWQLNAVAAGVPYLGINLGTTVVTVQNALTYPLNAIDVPDPSVAHFPLGYNDFYVQGLLGYSIYICDRWDLAAQGVLQASIGDVHSTIDHWYLNYSANVNINLGYGFGLFALPTLHLFPAVSLFLGPGVLWNEFSVNSWYTAGNIGVTGNYVHWLTAIALKAGTQIKLTSCADLFFTYQYANYDSVQWSNREPLSQQFLNAHYAPAANTFMVGISWHPRSTIN